MKDFHVIYSKTKLGCEKNSKIWDRDRGWLTSLEQKADEPITKCTRQALKFKQPVKSCHVSYTHRLKQHRKKRKMKVEFQFFFIFFLCSKIKSLLLITKTKRALLFSLSHKHLSLQCIYVCPIPLAILPRSLSNLLSPQLNYSTVVFL